jgi:Cu2+-exporting ATPase
VTVSNLRAVTERGVTIGADLVHANVAAGEAGKTVVFVVEDSVVLGLITLMDIIRPESAEAVAGLQKHGIRVAMLTGDSLAVGNSVAAQLGITEVFAEVLPAQKAEVIAGLQAGGTSVAMVGDGVNDAPALAQADIGIALGAGTDVAIDSAGLVLASSDPRGVLSALTLSRATYSLMRQNLFWATGYNVVAIPLAAGVLFAAGIVLSPALGAALMSISTIVVALNAQRLRRVKL